MKKLYTLALFGEPEPKELTPQEMSAKIDELEKSLNEKDTTIKSLTTERDDLQKKLNGLRITGLTRQVEPISKPNEPEEVQFEFDL